MTEVVTTPEEGTIPATNPEPAEVPTDAGTPAMGTVPTAVEAGGGSSQRNSVPVWAYAMIIAGALGAAGAGLRLVSSRSN